MKKEHTFLVINNVGRVIRTYFHRSCDCRITRYGVVFIVISLLAACTPVAAPSPTQTVVPTFTPLPTRTPLPTWTPTPVPTQTPIPPASVRLRWPQAVTALKPVPIEVEFFPPAGIAANAKIRVTVMDPAAETYAVFDLRKREGFR